MCKTSEMANESSGEAAAKWWKKLKK
jgi:hypothetical protein